MRRSVRFGPVAGQELDIALDLGCAGAPRDRRHAARPAAVLGPAAPARRRKRAACVSGESSWRKLGFRSMHPKLPACRVRSRREGAAPIVHALASHARRVEDWW